jgi:hypothetical protein
MTQEELISEPISQGFLMQSTVSRKWKTALFFRNREKTVLFLIRSRGVDVLETSRMAREMVNDDGLLSVSVGRDGDRFAELSYIESEASVHDRVLDICYRAANDKAIPDALFTRIGIGRKEWGAKFGDRSKRDASGEMRDIYYAASSGDGGDAYLGDGMWITPNGSIREKD